MLQIARVSGSDSSPAARSREFAPPWKAENFEAPGEFRFVEFRTHFRKGENHEPHVPSSVGFGIGRAAEFCRWIRACSRAEQVWQRTGKNSGIAEGPAIPRIGACHHGRPRG